VEAQKRMMKDEVVHEILIVIFVPEIVNVNDSLNESVIPSHFEKQTENRLRNENGVCDLFPLFPSHDKNHPFV
jgi:hypothetical protein